MAQRSIAFSMRVNTLIKAKPSEVARTRPICYRASYDFFTACQGATVSIGDGVEPTQGAESRKITIRGAQCQPMLHRKRSQVSVGHKVAVHAGKLEDFTKQFSVPLRWLGRPYGLTGEPGPHLTPGIDNRLGMLEHARICNARRNASKLAHGRPTGAGPFNCWSSHSRATRCCANESTWA
jgi:hypothetical protein